MLGFIFASLAFFTPTTPLPPKPPVVRGVPAVYAPVAAQPGATYNVLHFSGSGYQPGDNR